MAGPRGAKREETGTTRVVHRALAILRAFRATDRTLSLREIAQRAQLDKGTARRLLRTLMTERLIEQPQAGGDYSLSVGVLELAAGLTPASDLRQQAQSTLAAIAAATGATTFMGIVHDGAALCIARVDGGSAIQIRFWSVGGRMPLHCGAGPRTLLAHLPARIQARVLAGPLAKLTAATPTDPAALAVSLEQIRRRGWELSVDDVVKGIASIGLPVRNAAAEVLGAVSISGLHAHILADGQPRHLDIVRQSVRELERRLAGVSQTETPFAC
jgi:DNA-binding IclR family transcriptional regulator